MRRPERVVVLGCGWGGFRVLQKLRVGPERHVTCISKNNHFIFTPLLTTTTVGTLEFRNICEPVINLKRKKGDAFCFHHAEAVRLDLETSEVVCQSIYDVASSDSEGAQRFHPEFRVPYDWLVIATGEKGSAIDMLSGSHPVVRPGAQAATYGVPGVEQYTFPLRQLSDARLIRQRLIQVKQRRAVSFRFYSITTQRAQSNTRSIFIFNKLAFSFRRCFFPVLRRLRSFSLLSVGV